MLKIGIDGGGTTTRAVVIDAAHQVLGRGEAASSNHYSVGLERAIANVAAAADVALKAANQSRDDIEAWGLGLAGACTPAEQSLVRDAMRSVAGKANVVVDEDAAAAQAGAFGGEAGAVTIAGTGANCFGVSRDKTRVRTDGLGPLLGDRGSGYWIGEQTLRTICRVQDGLDEPTSLLQKSLEHYNLFNIDELVQLVYRADFERSRIAGLFPVVVECAENSDATACGILRQAGEELARTTYSVLKRIDLPRVAVSGGVLVRDTLVRATFEETLHSAVPQVQIGLAQFDAVIGAALLTDS